MSTDPKTLDRCGPDGVCKWLEERTEIAGAGSKGFRHIVTITLHPKADQAPMNWRGVSYHTSACDRGILLNYCPFCGGKPGSLANKSEKEGGG